MKRVEQVSEEAAAWMIELRDHPPTPARWAEFERWLAIGAHRAEFREMERTKALLGEHGLSALEGEGESSGAGAVRHKQVFARSAIAVAAAVVVGAMVALFLMREYAAKSVVAHTQSLMARVGELKRVRLEDGSVVTLNTDSAMDVSWSAQSRRVTFTRGEALFNVAHDRSRPFDVIIDDILVHAVGTSFSVRRYKNGRTDVLLVEGRISVGRAGAMRVVSQRSRIRIDGLSMHVAELSEEDQQRLLGWTEGRLVFQNTPLAEAVEEFNRYGSMKLSVEDPAIVNVKVGGLFRPNHPDSFVAAVTMLESGICTRVDGQTIYLRGCSLRKPVRVQQ